MLFIRLQPELISNTVTKCSLKAVLRSGNCTNFWMGERKLDVLGSCGVILVLYRRDTEEVASLHMAEGLELEDFQEPFQPKPFYDSVANVIFQMPKVYPIACLGPAVLL